MSLVVSFNNAELLLLGDQALVLPIDVAARDNQGAFACSSSAKDIRYRAGTYAELMGHRVARQPRC